MPKFKQLTTKVLQNDKALMLIGQVVFMGVGYLVQVILSKLLNFNGLFSQAQFINFLTNFFNLFFASSIATIALRDIARSNNHSTNDKIATTIGLTTLLTVAEAILIAGAVFVGFLANRLDSSMVALVILCAIQSISFGLLNNTFSLLIASHKVRKFIGIYIAFAILKSTTVAFAALVGQQAIFIIGGIALAQLLMAILCLLLTRTEIRIIWTWDFKYAKSIFFEQWDILLSNLLLFGIVNLAVINSFFKEDSSVNFGLFTLIQPWILLPYYVVSSAGNIYLREFASGAKQKSDIQKVIYNLLGLTVGVAMISLLVSTVFFTVVYPQSFAAALELMLLSLPVGICLTIINTVISIWQGLAESARGRNTLVTLFALFLIGSLWAQDAKQFALLTSASYIVSLIVILWQLPKKHD